MWCGMSGRCGMRGRCVVWNEGKVCVVGVLMDLHTTGGHHEGGRERYTQGESGSYAEEI